MNRLVLYTGTLCHLCEQARQVLHTVMTPGLSFEDINIDGSEDLKARYGVRIPVVAVITPAGDVVAEKGWPFSPGQARRLIEQHLGGD